MKVEEVTAKVKEAIEKGDVEILKAIIEEPVIDEEVQEASPDDKVSVKEYISEFDDGLLSDLFDYTFKNKSSSFFTFLKNHFPETGYWDGEIEMIKAEYHQVAYYDKGTLYVENRSDYYQVDDEGNLVLDKDKLEEIQWDADWDLLGTDNISAQNGNFETVMWGSNDPEIVETLRRACIKCPKEEEVEEE